MQATADRDDAPNMPRQCDADEFDETSERGNGVVAAVVEAWPELPEAIRAGIVAMVKW